MSHNKRLSSVRYASDDEASDGDHRGDDVGGHCVAATGTVEVIGQLVRLLVAGPGSMTRRYPLGNTGGADVSAVTPMPIPADIQAVLDRTVKASS
jgi:hypothetical protein